MHPKHTTFSPLFSLLPLSATASAQEPATKADLQALELKLTNQMTEMGKRLTGQIAALDKRLTTRIDVLFWAMSALIGIVLAVIAFKF